MASEKDFELLDEYVGNRLNAEDKTAFEQKLNVDPELKNELQLQQKVVDSIRKARAAELKQMLINVPISSIPTDGGTVLTQVGIWAVVAGLAGAGLYYYLKPSDATIPQEPVREEVTSTQEQHPVESAGEEAQSQVVEAETEAAASVTAKDIEKSKEVVSKPLTPASQKKAGDKPVDKPVDKTAVTPAVPSPLNVFDPTEEVAETKKSVDTDGNVDTPTTTPSIVVETTTDKRYNFHYQFKNEKLYLYGSFEKNLYEIMEFFSDNKRTMFLYYKDDYYLLNEENDKVKPLAPIKDTSLLKKLRDYRGN